MGSNVGGAFERVRRFHFAAWMWDVWGRVSVGIRRRDAGGGRRGGGGNCLHQHSSKLSPRSLCLFAGSAILWIGHMARRTANSLDPADCAEDNFSCSPRLGASHSFFIREALMAIGIVRSHLQVTTKQSGGAKINRAMNAQQPKGMYP
jgi:hypothetical protein